MDKKLLEVFTWQLQDVFAWLKNKLINDSKKLRQVIILEGRFNENQNDFKKGIVSYEVYSTKNTRIRNSLVELFSDTKVKKSRIEKVGFEVVEKTDFKAYYPNEVFLTMPNSNFEIPHVNVFRNESLMPWDNINFQHENRPYHIYNPVYDKLRKKLAKKLRYNESRLRIKDIIIKPNQLDIKCQKARYAHVLVTNHSSELRYDEFLLKEIFAPEKGGKIIPLAESNAANPAGCNCMLLTSDNFLLIQERSGSVETSKNKYAPSVSGGTEFSKEEIDKMDPLLQLYKEMLEELHIRKDKLSSKPILLAISRDIERNGLPEFIFFAKLSMSFEEASNGVQEARDIWEHSSEGLIKIENNDLHIIEKIRDKNSSLALKASLIYYLEFKESLILR